MARIDKRARATGRLGVTKGERYALLPDEVLRSEAVRELDGVSRWILVVISAQYHGRNNGRLTLPHSAAIHYGIRSKDSLSRGLKQCVEHQLLQITHQGGLPPLGCSRYALTWKSMDADEKLDIAGTLQPSNSWAKWQNASPTTGPVCPDHRTTDTPDCPDHRTTGGTLLPRPSGTSKTLGMGDQMNGTVMHESQSSSSKLKPRKPARSHGESKTETETPLPPKIVAAISVAAQGELASELAKRLSTSDCKVSARNVEAIRNRMRELEARKTR